MKICDYRDSCSFSFNKFLVYSLSSKNGTLLKLAIGFLQPTNFNNFWQIYTTGNFVSGRFTDNVIAIVKRRLFFRTRFNMC